MMQRELLLGSATFVVVIVAGFFSAVSVAQHYPAVPTQTVADTTAPQTTPQQTSPLPKTTTPTAAPQAKTPCVGADGSWKNWVYANVPMLSPKCPPGQ